ncbi:MAG: serine/threonine-protein kinase [Myxococcota bacterium]
MPTADLAQDDTLIADSARDVQAEPEPRPGLDAMNLGICSSTRGAISEDPLSDALAGYTHERIGGLVMQRLFGGEPVTTTIGRYSVLDRLGQGGMGTVFAAYDNELDRKVAIKVIRSVYRSDAHASLRLKREAQAMARLSHPNVVTVHEVGEADGKVFVAMEFIRGQSIDGWVRTDPPWREIVGAFIQAGRGIIAAHEAGLVHRDLKPHNIMRTEDGVVKVLDFGLARAGDPEDSSDDRYEPTTLTSSSSVSGENRSALRVDLTRTGAVLGTPAYMAPEQHRGEVADAHTDQYGFCVALYQALYRQLPFDATTLPELVERIIAGRLRPPPADTPVPAWVHRVVVRGLSCDRQQRWPSMQALLHALGRNPARTRRRRLTLLSLGLAAGVGGFLLSETRHPVADACPEAGDERRMLWSEDRRERIATAFAATGSELATSTLERAGAAIGEYVDVMGQSRAEACQALRRGQQSQRVFDLRTACLDERRAGFDELLTRFEHPDAAVVERAAWAVARLPKLHRCADVDALTAAVAPPEDADVAGQVKQQREALASVSAQVSAGSYDEAIERSRAIRRTAEQIGYEPLVAEAELGLGVALMESSQDQPAYEALSRGMVAGLRSRHYEAATEALARRMWIVADPMGQPNDALASEQIAAAMLDALGRPPRLHWLLLNNRAVAFFRGGLALEAKRTYEQALEVLTSSPADTYPVELVSTRINLAMLESTSLGRPDVAVQQLRSARIEASALVGPQHPRVVEITSMLAENLADAGRPHEALVEFEAARALIPRIDPYGQIVLLNELATLHRDQRRHDLALEVASEALHRAEREFGDDFVHAFSRLQRGHALVGLGRVEEGIEELRQAVEHTRARAGDSSRSVVTARLWAGQGLRRAGRLEQAQQQLEQAHGSLVELETGAAASIARKSFTLVELYIELGFMPRAEALMEQIARAQDAVGLPPDSDYRRKLSQHRGALALAQDQRAEAADAYAAACAGLARTSEPHAPPLAECRLAHARALGSRPEALMVAQQARDAFAALGEGFAPELAQAERVLAPLRAQAGATWSSPSRDRVDTRDR